jgi:hypothetical protein
MPDQTVLDAYVTDHGLYLVIMGSPYCTSELAEQLVWLAGALRSSPSEGIAYCTPKFKAVSESDHKHAMAADAYFSIHYEAVPLTYTEPTSGSCWRSMFRNPVIVKGYPIPRRARPNTGLEISLGTMAAMTNATRLFEFCGTSFLKGFSAMLATSAIAEDLVIWHYLFNPNGKYISYSDPTVSELGKLISVPSDVVEKSRHIVGWCEDVKCYAGKAHSAFHSLVLVTDALQELPMPTTISIHQGCKSPIRSALSRMCPYRQAGSSP